MIQNSFYEELEQVFDNFTTCQMKVILRDCKAKLGRENIFKPRIGNKIYVRIVMKIVLEL